MAALDLTATFDRLSTTLGKQYGTAVPAKALFWQKHFGGGAMEYGFRLEAPTIIREFMDNVNVGTEREGWLFFQSIHYLTNARVRYSIYPTTPADAQQKAVIVQFYYDDSRKPIPVAIFIAKDPDATIAQARENLVGNWIGLEVANVAAHVQKAADLPEIDFTVPAIGKRAILKAKDEAIGHIIDVWGTFTFKTIGNFKAGSKTYADYSTDRIIFSRAATGSRDFTGVFYPMANADPEVSGKALTFEADDVIWSDIQ